MLQGRLEGVALALVNIPLRTWQSQVVVLQKLEKCLRSVCAFFCRLVLPYALIACLGK